MAVILADAAAVAVQLPENGSKKNQQAFVSSPPSPR
jgi:hypothetical protein